MSNTTAFRLSNTREVFNSNCGIDVNSGSLGGTVIITTSTDFSLIPPTTFDKYYYIYIVNTDATINVTLPDTANVTRGWRARFILNSSANTGVINFLASGATFIGFISSALSSSGAEVQFSNVSGYPYKITYYVGNTTSSAQRMITYDIFNGVTTIPIVKPLTAMQFFSFSGLAGSTTIDGNTTTPIAIPWDSNTPGRYIDNQYFDNSISTRITALPSEFYIRLTACIYVNTAGGATAITIAQFRINGGASGITSEVSVGTISNSATQVINIITSSLYATTGTYYELKIGKAATSGGTNIVDRVNSYLFVEYINV